MSADAQRLAATITAIEPASEQAAAAAQALLDAKTKPRGSLGRLERLAARLAGIRGLAAPGELAETIVVVAGDHGYAEEGVSAYPQEVTCQMLGNFAAGGAAINVLAQQLGVPLLVIDAGVTTPLDDQAVRRLRIAAGTANATAGPAMTHAQALQAIGNGIELAGELAAGGIRIVALGEMGIANTTAASAVTAALLEIDPAAVCGTGTGIPAELVPHKADVVRRALASNRPRADDPVGSLAAVGGFEIGTLTGLALGAAAARMVVLLDGFITGAAALLAARLAPVATDFMVASHRSPEPGHALQHEELGLDPLLDLGLRLGEGTGAALALPLLRASLALLERMATFAEAGVSDAGR